MLLGLALFVTFAGSAFADAPLNETIDDLLGIHYKYGGTTERGFDCSGFTSYVFEQFGIDLPRTSRSQAGIGTKITKKDLRKGDLLFFNTNGKNISHVGIYIGGGMMAHSSSKHGVSINKISEKYYVNRFVTARRILNEEQYKKIATEIEQKADIVSANTASLENDSDESATNAQEDVPTEENVEQALE